MADENRHISVSMRFSADRNEINQRVDNNIVNSVSDGTEINTAAEKVSVSHRAIRTRKIKSNRKFRRYRYIRAKS